ncbi:MAG: acyltransferase [Cyanobacteria bacterium J06592_8]
MMLIQQLKLTDKLHPSEENKKKYPYNYAIEGLRGLAALWVGYAHVFNFENFLDPTYHPPKSYWTYLHASHGAVLIFFLLSGYVIGLTNTKPCSQSGIVKYLMRRGVRLFPIYAVAILFSVLVLPKDSLIKILGNLFFLQPFVVPVLSSNPILWTLNYEVIYYLAFLVIWYFQPRFIYLILGSLTVSILGWFIPSFPQFLSSYASGWIFWLIGLWLAWRVEPNLDRSPKFPLISYLLLLGATNHFATGKIVLNGLGFPNSAAGIVNLSDLFLLPICLMIMVVITNRQLPGKSQLNLLCFTLPILNILFLVTMGRLLENLRWGMAALYTIVALIIFGYKQKANILEKLTYIGSISYGFYVLHIPMMHLVKTDFPLQGSVSSFCLRLLTWFALTVGFSSLLELVMQPKIKIWFNSKFLNSKT